MSTFKAELYQVCEAVSAEFPGWDFTSGVFKNKSLKHSDLIVDPGFSFDRGFTNLQPSVLVVNKRCDALYAEIFELKKRQHIPVSMVSFQVVAHTLKYLPEPMRVSGLICQDKTSYIAAAAELRGGDQRTREFLIDRAIGINDSHIVLAAMMKDAISFIDSHYELSSEQSLLAGLPAKYSTRHANSPYDEMEKQKGVVLCVVHLLTGDFDFVERYRSDEFKTVFPKRVSDVDKIIAALPQLKKRYAEIGSVI